LKNLDNNYEDEITLKELILKVNEYFWYLWGKKWWIIVAGLIGGATGFYLAHMTPVTYTAELTYMVNEDEDGGIGGAGAILSQIGLGGGSSSEYNLDKIVALSKSRRIVQQALMDSIEIDGEEDLIANHLINVLHLHDSWVDSENPELWGFYFTNSQVGSFNRTANGALKQIFNIVVGGIDTEGLLSNSYKESTGIFRLTLTSESEHLSSVLAERIYSCLSDFYVRQSTKKQRETLSQLSNKVDSIKTVLQSAEYRLAKFLFLISSRFIRNVMSEN